MKSSKLRMLKAIGQGDVVFGLDGAGREKLLLVYKATKATIFARHVTSQAEIRFRRDGNSKKIKGGGHCTIVSTRPLPPHEYGVVLGLDRKMRLGQVPDGAILTKDEIRVILKSGDYVRARLLVDADLQIPVPEDAKPATFD